MSQVFVVEPSGSSKSADHPSELPALASDLEKVRLPAIKAELAEMRDGLLELAEMDPGDALRRLSSYIARLAGLRAELWDMNTKRATQVRTQHLDPMREDLKSLFDICSRGISLLQLEWDISRGQ